MLSFMHTQTAGQCNCYFGSSQDGALILSLLPDFPGTSKQLSKPSKATDVYKQHLLSCYISGDGLFWFGLCFHGSEMKCKSNESLP